jgi:hypothetical protein
MEPETFKIAPRPRGGVNLTGPGLPWPLWFAREEEALSHARHKSEGGGIVEVVDAGGEVLRSEPIAPTQARLYGQGRA